jgi:hypothetical protein
MTKGGAKSLTHSDSRRLREQAATELERCAELTQRLAQTRSAVQRAREAVRDLLGVDPEANSGPTGDPPDLCSAEMQSGGTP